MMTSAELRSLSRADLVSELSLARKSYQQARFSYVSGVSVALHTVRSSKKYVAQILTAMSSLSSQS